MGFKVGQYVIKKTDEDKDDADVFQITSGKADAWKLTKNDDDAQVELSTEQKDDDLLHAGMGKFLAAHGMQTVEEIAYNGIVYSIVQKMRKNGFFGHEVIDFVISDAIYELVGKYYMDTMLGFAMPAPVAIGYGIGMGEFQDGLLKTIPIVIIQQIVQKVMRKSKFSHRLMKNVVDCAAACVIANVAQRNLAKPVQSGLAGKAKKSGTKKIYRF